ncbi:homogentisate 1,2-dioxygenase [Crocinitomicaceae bacterium CZZ-1]|uniref:Homogentisate 1,2-dioxygenase n=1 Tax=Taishania pollutisoli TaxID=2766479 RepID=A0A8J6TXS9_9FLAO|nr:homogentisate 1,2-dioxygenase [Taishania pollutisoli]MBC9812971.1 homogentisate 1,2-dioxygenase [Taishania pollutisoli]MBX2948705.1 homogentisate 1,2-dioxygenase [Crocinitomicaceae bacterium]NGF75674.1 homogentisate 1,2-dioxygenase [Fluviicola sp. SGL-29]
MPFYHKLGTIPSKRHIQFRQADGSLYQEQLFGTIGFDGMSSLLYHIHPPTVVNEILGEKNIAPEIAIEKNMVMRSLQGFNVPPTDDYLESRVPVLVNNDVYIELASPKKSMTDYFYKNADADEVIFIHRGSGVLKTQLGNIDFSYGDYLVVPRGMIYQLHFESEDNRLFIVQSFHPVYTPKRYRNWFGQLLEHAPFCERDIRPPHVLEPIDEKGDFLIRIKKEDVLYSYVYAYHPFDVVGWDGYNYPYAFSIHEFEPITGRVHQPPPVHQTFETSAFVICSFVPRLYDYHPLSIPAPYNHSNIDSDEVLYYVDGDFMSRNHVEKGQITLHPAGIPHGPHPGAYERSIGKKDTQELAVMVDTFKPLKLTKQALGLELKEYKTSWKL